MSATQYSWAAPFSVWMNTLSGLMRVIVMGAVRVVDQIVVLIPITRLLRSSGSPVCSRPDVGPDWLLLGWCWSFGHGFEDLFNVGFPKPDDAFCCCAHVRPFVVPVINTRRADPEVAGEFLDRHELLVENGHAAEAPSKMPACAWL